MRIKVDENIGSGGVAFLRASGHDVSTVREQGLGGQPDEIIFQACASEARVLITLDRDFGQTHRFTPGRAAGIVILELGNPASLRSLTARLADFLAFASVESVAGRLWIVEAGRIRVHIGPDDDTT